MSSSFSSHRRRVHKWHCEEELAAWCGTLQKNFAEQVNVLVVRLFEEVQRKVADAVADDFVYDHDRNAFSSHVASTSESKTECINRAFHILPDEPPLGSNRAQQHESPLRFTDNVVSVESTMPVAGGHFSSAFGKSCINDAYDIESEAWNRHSVIPECFVGEGAARSMYAKGNLHNPVFGVSTCSDVEAFRCSNQEILPEAAHFAQPAGEEDMEDVPSDMDGEQEQMSKRQTAASATSAESAESAASAESDLLRQKALADFAMQRHEEPPPRSGRSIERISLLGGDGDPCVFRDTYMSMIIWKQCNVVCLILMLWSDTAAMAGTWNDTGDGPLGRTFNLISLAIFATDILVSFNTAFEEAHGRIITNRRRIAKNYLKTWFAFDFLVTFPYNLVLTTSSLSRTFRLARLLKFTKMIRALKILKELSANSSIQDELGDFLANPTIGLDIRFVLRIWRIMCLLLKFWAAIFVEGHILCCYILPTEGDHLEIITSGGDSQPVTLGMRYFAVLRWSMAGCLTGVPDHHAVELQLTMSPQVIQLIFVFFSAGNFLCGVALFSNLKGSDDSDLDFKIRALQAYLRNRGSVSNYARKSIVRYHRGQQSGGIVKEVGELLRNLPPHLKEVLAVESYGEIILELQVFRQGPFFQKGSVSITFWHEICKALELRFISKKDYAIILGHRYEGMYFLLNSALFEITSESSLDSLSNLNLGDNSGVNPLRRKLKSQYSSALERQQHGRPWFIGIESLFAPPSSSKQLATFSVMALSAAEAVVLHRKDLDNIIKHNASWSFYVKFVRSQVAHGKVHTDKLAEKGLPDEIYEDYGRLSSQSPLEDAGTASAQLGVGLAYIQEKFRNDLFEEVGISDFATTNFAALRPIFWGSPPKGFRGSATATCPRDGLQGTAIVDVLDDQDRQRATHFVSWCWSYTVESVVLAFTTWANEKKRLEKSQAFLWMCFFCNNQRKLLVDGDVGDSNLAETFASRLQSVGRMIIMLDCIENPRYTSRLWCIFEAYTAAHHDIKIYMTLPPKAKTDIFSKFSDPGGFLYFLTALTNIDAESATATFPEDEENIRQLIRRTTGFAAVNRAVKSALTKWLGKVFEKHLLKQAELLKKKEEGNQEGQPEHGTIGQTECFLAEV